MIRIYRQLHSSPGYMGTEFSALWLVRIEGVHADRQTLSQALVGPRVGVQNSFSFSHISFPNRKQKWQKLKRQPVVDHSAPRRPRIEAPSLKICKYIFSTKYSGKYFHLLQGNLSKRFYM